MWNKLFIVFLFLIVPNSSFAQLDAVETIDVKDIPSEKILTKDDQDVVKEEIKRKTFDYVVPLKNDYVDQFNRGTIEYHPSEYSNIDMPNGSKRLVKKFGNYSYHKTIIANGTTIKDVNFTQKMPHSVVIEGKDLTFINCNLTNVEIDPTWTLTDSLSIQSEVEIVEENGKKYRIQRIEKDGKMVENQRTDITALPVSK